LVVLALADVYPETYGVVRFGKVLGRAGSVIPIFQKQIERKQPLTVTHEGATRYFVTIPEAVQLILQASLLDEFRGQVAILEMGEPVRIVDLARNMLRLVGLPSGNGEHLVFTGLRAREKLHEELSAPTEESSPTVVPKVRMIRTVRLMECNPGQAIRTNVLAARIVAEKAGQRGCRKFVLVSTDKAVRPESIMGASKPTDRDLSGALVASDMQPMSAAELAASKAPKPTRRSSGALVKRAPASENPASAPSPGWDRRARRVP
jgi:FlaA1/EpsC-like NDP-sugar epimerase